MPFLDAEAVFFVPEELVFFAVSVLLAGVFFAAAVVFFAAEEVVFFAAEADFAAVFFAVEPEDFVAVAFAEVAEDLAVVFFAEVDADFLAAEEAPFELFEPLAEDALFFFGAGVSTSKKVISRFAIFSNHSMQVL